MLSIQPSRMNVLTAREGEFPMWLMMSWGKNGPPGMNQPRFPPTKKVNNELIVFNIVNSK